MDQSGTHINFSTNVVMMRLVLAVFLVETAYVLPIASYIFLNPPVSYAHAFIVVMWLLQTVKFFVLAFLVVKIVGSWAARKITIDRDHLIIHKGIGTTDEEVLELYQLRSLSLHQSWLGRRLNYGTLDLEFGLMGSPMVVRLDNIQDPARFERLLSDFIVSQNGHRQDETLTLPLREARREV